MHSMAKRKAAAPFCGGNDIGWQLTRLSSTDLANLERKLLTALRMKVEIESLSAPGKTCLSNVSQTSWALAKSEISLAA